MSDKPVSVSKGMIYANKKDKNDRVVVIMWSGDVVLYAPEGSGREFRLGTLEFLDKYERLDKEPVVA